MKLQPMPLVLASLALLSACRGSSDSVQAAPARAPEVILSEAQELELTNACAPFPGVLSCGQPTPEQMDALAAAGYRTFVNLRPESEPGTGWEAARVGELGVTYAGIAVAGADDVTETNARLLSAVLDGASANGPAVVYCRSGNRVGALFALEAYYVDGKTPEEALAIGKAAGLTKLEPAVRQKLGLPSED